jgi:hypothetical protein
MTHSSIVSSGAGLSMGKRASKALICWAASIPDGEERTGDSFPSTALHPEDLNPEEQLLRHERENLEFAAMTLVLESGAAANHVLHVETIFHECLVRYCGPGKFKDFIPIRNTV